MEEIKSNGRIISFDVLRIIAAFAVVLLHISGDRFATSYPTNEWITRLIYDSLVRWCVPVFIMISGALFLDQNRRIGIRVLFLKNVSRIISIFVFWSFFYALYDANVEKRLGVIDVLMLTVEGPFHFWFLKILLGLYVTIPILRVVTQNKSLEEYFIIIAILTAYLIPMFFTALGLYNEEIKTFFIWFFEGFGIKIALGYVGYFVLGHYLSTFQLSVLLRKSILIMGGGSVVSVIILTQWYSHIIGEPSQVFFDNLNLFTLFESLAVFLSIRGLNVSKKLYPIIIKLSKLTLGVYLIHVFVYRFAYIIFGINSTTYNYVFFIPCFSLIVFMISCLISALFVKIPVLKKFVS